MSVHNLRAMYKVSIREKSREEGLMRGSIGREGLELILCLPSVFGFHGDKFPRWECTGSQTCLTWKHEPNRLLVSSYCPG